MSLETTSSPGSFRIGQFWHLQTRLKLVYNFGLVSETPSIRRVSPLIPRTAPPSASTRLRDAATDIVSSMSSVGDMFPSDEFQNCAIALRARLAKPELYVDFAFNNEVRAEIASYLGEMVGRQAALEKFAAGSPFKPFHCDANGTATRVSMWPLNCPPMRDLVDPFPPILACALRDSGGSQPLVDALNAAAEDRLILVLLPSMSSSSLAETIAPGVRRLTATRECLVDDLRTLNLDEIVPVLWDYSIASALRSLLNVFRSTMLESLEGVRAEKAVVQKQIPRLQNRPPTLVYDSNGNLSALMENMNKFEGQSIERFQDFVKADRFGIHAKVSHHLKLMEELHSERGPKGIEVYLSSTSITKVMDVLHDSLRSFFDAELAYFSSIKDTAFAEVSDFGSEQSSHLPPYPVTSLPTTDSVEGLIRSNLLIRRHYRAEIANPGAVQLIFEARKPLMILWMILTILGLSKLRSSTTIMVPISVMIVGLGGLYAVYSARNERKRAVLKHLEEAREQLRAEVGRMITDVQNAWRQLLSQCVARHKEAIQAYVEVASRQENERLSERRAKIQNQMPGLDAREKRLVLLSVTVDNSLGELKRIRSELKLRSEAILDLK